MLSTKYTFHDSFYSVKDAEGNTPPLPEISNSKAAYIVQRLKEHGEVQVILASKTEYSFHLGDYGEIGLNAMCFRDNQGSTQFLAYDQIESIFTHMGYKEG